MNHCIFMGNLVEDPQVKTVNGAKGETSVLNFRIGVNTYISKDRTEAAFPTIEAWGVQADMIAKFFRKGDLIRVFTRLRSDKWEGEDGTTKYRDKYVLEKFEFSEAGRKKSGDAAAEGDETGAEAAEEPPPTKPASGKRGRKPVGAGAGGGGDTSIDF